ncbi:MAG: guanylate kinase [Lachnospiraceae bacterium]
MAGKIFCLIGKSASGKDTVYRDLIGDPSLSLRSVTPYTTRPMRAGEMEGREYHFRSREAFERALKDGKIIEYRRYDTVYGPWYYYTEDDGQIDLEQNSYLLVGVLQSYVNIRNYFGDARVVPLYLYVEDGERLQRALDRERAQKNPGYREMCRRFLADSEDFSEDKLREAGISRRFENRDHRTCVAELRVAIREEQEKP